MKRCDVVLLAVPFVETAGSKIRPAVIFQNDFLNKTLRETVIVSVTSNLSNADQPHHLFIDVSTADGKATGLLTNSVIRAERLHTVPQSDIQKIIGTLPAALISKLNDCLKSALSIL